ncbi:MAG: helix-turn-helix transcriptional regulator [Candidatus Gastranaerophilales bacterium]|nr:helix-turn-helix transcriptional regulator [Candidatus Gastranaerophilales bacterium]
MKKELARKFGLRVKFERMKKDLTQEQLAELADISRATITKLEKNLSSPTLDIVEDIARALGYEPYELFIFKDLEI